MGGERGGKANVFPYHNFLPLELEHDARPSHLLPCSTVQWKRFTPRGGRRGEAHSGRMVSRSLSSAGPDVSAFRLAMEMTVSGSSAFVCVC